MRRKKELTFDLQYWLWRNDMPHLWQLWSKVIFNAIKKIVWGASFGYKIYWILPAKVWFKTSLVKKSFILSAVLISLPYNPLSKWFSSFWILFRLAISPSHFILGGIFKSISFSFIINCTNLYIKYFDCRPGLLPTFT